METDDARLIAVYDTKSGRRVYPGGYDVAGEPGSLTWSDGKAAYVLQDNRLVVVSGSDISTIPCADATFRIREEAANAVMESPELAAAMQHDDLVLQLSVSETVREALQAQIDASQFAAFSETPLCMAIVRKSASGDIAAMTDLFGVQAGSYVQMCRKSK